ncbi:serine/threonine-protein kinase [Nocardia inohanensis]|uniref:serine/threonine-protein kinase n=1 Tax=Nocardia inohanensis TaxID=209246 RepID=UPI000AFAAC96|nr:serine/threonine-protein kinase [Nocardia inohanensis]
MSLQPGTVFAGFAIERLLGVGGMGAVYLAAHPRLPRQVALKVLTGNFGADLKTRTAFEREATLAAGLDHPNIVPVYDRSSADDDALWLAMRYIDGGDAAALLTEQPAGLDPARAIRLVADAAHALDYAHARGVLHRDVKPANLLIDTAGRAGERAVLTDFGIARTLDDTVTLSGIAATFAYAAPERFSDDPADHRADIYSLGCTLYQMLTGRPPFPRKDQAAVIGAHLTAPPPLPSAVRPDLPIALDAVIATALAKSPQDRYPSCAALAEAAAAALPREVDPEDTESMPSAAERPRPVTVSGGTIPESERPTDIHPPVRLPEAVERSVEAGRGELPNPDEALEPAEQVPPATAASAGQVQPGGAPAGVVRAEPSSAPAGIVRAEPNGALEEVRPAKPDDVPGQVRRLPAGGIIEPGRVAGGPRSRRRMVTVSALLLAGVSVAVVAAFAVRDNSGSPVPTTPPTSSSVVVSQQLTPSTVSRTSEVTTAPPPIEIPPSPETETAITAAPPVEQAQPRITVQQQANPAPEVPAVVPQTRVHQWPG